ncbi:MAG: LytR C-terminal domain-containing protein [Ignavibacteriae bacterium]|nr:LytR C-terminal domain-containing protein [Ignavibacteriota bacterium]
MEPHTEIPTEQPSAPENNSGKKMLLFLLNIVIAILLVATGYFGHKFFDRFFPPKQPIQVTEQKKEPPRPTEVLQVDVLNGCGEKGVASRFTNFLRAKGYDVVEMKNYKTSSIPRTLVIDRMGNMKPARDIAELLGVADTNILQQLNPDYFVDVSVVIGEDFYELTPPKEKK